VEKIPLGINTHIWEDNIIKIDIGETGVERVDCIHLAQVAVQWWELVKTGVNIRVPQDAGNFLTSLMTISFIIKTQFHVSGGLRYLKVPGAKGSVSPNYLGTGWDMKFY
jgi:hypothetical protein